MNTLGMEYSYVQRDPSRRYKGMAVVVAAHALIGWALLSGMGVQILPKPKLPPIQVFVEPFEVPPPPPPVHRTIRQPNAPSQPRETYVPETEVVQTEASNTVIEATPQPSTVPPVIAPPQATQAPPRAAATDIRLACPTQVPPEMPRKALQDGTAGVVRAQALISGGVVRDVQILSGPRIFHAPVRAAMLQYKCSNDASGEVTAIQEFNFRLE